MAIRTKRYALKAHEDFGVCVRAIQITEKNLTDIVAYICRNGGAATGHNGRHYKAGSVSVARSRPARIRIKQLCFGHNGPTQSGKGWAKQDWRVAELGDYILRHDNGQFERIKKSVFEEYFEVVK